MPDHPSKEIAKICKERNLRFDDLVSGGMPRDWLLKFFRCEVDFSDALSRISLMAKTLRCTPSYLESLQEAYKPGSTSRPRKVPDEFVEHRQTLTATGAYTKTSPRLERLDERKKRQPEGKAVAPSTRRWREKQKWQSPDFNAGQPDTSWMK